MPDPLSPHDPFADMFGSRPDPRARAAGPDSSAGGANGDSATGGNPAEAPLSRRAAREAMAAQQQEGPRIPVPVATQPFEPTVASPADAAPAAGRPTTAQQPRAAAPGGLDDLFSGHTSTDDIGMPPPPPDKRKRRIGGWIALGVVLLLLGGIAGGTWYVWTTYEDKIREFMGWEEPKDYDAGLAEGEALITIVSGDTGSTISRTLFDAGVTKTPEAFYEYLVDTGQNPPFVPGVFRLQQKMTSEAALAAIMDPASKLENSVLLTEGLTQEQTLERLSEGLGIPLEDFEAAVADPGRYGVTVDPAIAAAGGQPLEGWLFPAMYTFDPGVTAEDVIGTLVTRTMTSLDDAGVPEADRHEILTIASIIQREGKAADFDKVSRVIQNRLSPDNQETFGKLEMDSTAQYGFGEMHDGTASSSEEALNDPNPWNTYYHAGLPIGPISNPGDDAIAAAMHPADGPWFYFVTWNMDTGETIFSATYAEHLKGVQKWEDWCAANDYRGC